MWGAGNNATSIAVLRPKGATMSGIVAGTWTIAGGLGVSIEIGALTFLNIAVTELPFVIGPGQQPGALEKFSGAIQTDAVTPTATYMADPGSAVALAAGNAALVPQRYASSQRLILGLRATTLVGPIPAPITCTLYINGVATLMKVTIAAGSPLYTKFSDFTHPRLLNAGDDFDLRLDDPGGSGVGANFQVSAVLEFAT
jgi:hypothetical protein